MFRRIVHFKDRLSAHFRERLNPFFSPIRRLFLKTRSFTIISNNCWGGHVYRYFGVPYLSPTIGTYFFSEDYLKFLQNLEYYLSCDIRFISCHESKYADELFRRGDINTTCPIGVIDDIEIIFLHYHSNLEAYEKWNRRKNRIDMNHLYVKFSEMNMCTIEQLKLFDNLPYKNKFTFVHKDYGLKSQIIFKDCLSEKEVSNDTFAFRKYINLIKWINKGL